MQQERPGQLGGRAHVLACDDGFIMRTAVQVPFPTQEPLCSLSGGGVRFGVPGVSDKTRDGAGGHVEGRVYGWGLPFLPRFWPRFADQRPGAWPGLGQSLHRPQFGGPR